MAEEVLKFPPAGVETQPTGEVVPLRDAARIFRKDHRTIRSAIIDGRIRGGAQPHAQRLHWYVYADQLPVDPFNSHQPAHPEPASAPADRYAELQGQVASLTEALSLALASEAEILSAMDDYKAAADGYRMAGQKFQSAADGFRGALLKHRDALAQFVTPGHIGDLDTLP